MFICHQVCSSCSDKGCKRNDKVCQSATKSCCKSKTSCKHGKEEACTAACKSHAKKSGMRHEMLTSERADFDSLLSEDEKIILTKVKSEVANMGHESLMSSDEATMMEHQKTFFAKIESVVNAHKVELEGIMASGKGHMGHGKMKHGEHHMAHDSTMNSDESQMQKHHDMMKQMTPEQHFEMFCIHFLLM